MGRGSRRRRRRRAAVPSPAAVGAVTAPPRRRRRRVGVGAVLGGLVLVAVVVANVVRGVSGGSSAGDHEHSDATPLPALTAVPATGAPPVEPSAENGRARVRLEVSAVDPGAATGSVRLSWAMTKDDTEQDSTTTLPWSTEAVVDPDAYLRVSAFTSGSDERRTLLCRILVGGVVVTQERGADYVSCSTSADRVLLRS